MVIITDVEFFQLCYLKTDPDQLGRQMVDMDVKPGSLIIFYLQYGTTNSTHYREEFTLEPNLTLKLTSNE